MSIQRILLLVLLFATGITATLLIRRQSEAPASMPAHSPPAVAVPPAPVVVTPSPPVRPSPAPQPVDRLPKVRPPPAVVPQAVPSEAEDDEQTDKEQVDAALAQLQTGDAEQRIDAAEQLGAFPTREAEQALTQALLTDVDPEVRNTAAQSLGYVEKPTDPTLTALFSALEDQNEEVRGSALSTLEDQMLGTEEGSRLYAKIMAGLRAKVDARSVPEETRSGIRDLLNDMSVPSN